MLRRILNAAGLALVAVAWSCGDGNRPVPLARLVDEYLNQFAERHPSIAAGNGLHAHDDALEDFSAAAITREIEWLRTFRKRLDLVDLAALTADDRVDHRILLGIVDGWLLDLDGVRSWTRNPMIYASAISAGVHDLMTMESAPAEERIGRAAAKLKNVPRLLTAARENIKNPPRVFLERAIVMFRGASGLLANDLALAFASVADERLQGDLKSAASTARSAIDEYAAELETRVLPIATGDYAVGTVNVEARYRAEELIDLPAASLLSIGERELRKVQADFESAAFIKEKQLVQLPDGERVIVAAAPPFDLGLASMHSSPPLEAHPVKSYYYVTDAQADWSAERQDAWLQKFNYPTLADISAHEVAPGHYVHSLFMRRTPGKIRRIWIGLNPFPQPSSGQDGWAHYAEQLVADEGFKQEDPRYRLAQTSEALTRICRMIVGLRLHSKEWSIDQAAAFFESQAHLPAPAARQEATRGTYDPTYGGYFLGKLAAFKLRRDYQAKQGSGFDLREFHERVMTNGIAPWWAHRQLLLPGDSAPVID